MSGHRGSISARLAAGTRVLVIEDSVDIAEFLRAYFRASGYQLDHIDPVDADTALRSAAALAPHCILLDVSLRGFSGLDVYRLLQAEPAFARVPVILVTGDTQARLRSAGLARAIDGHVAKPFSVSALAELVAERVASAQGSDGDSSGRTGDADEGEDDARRS